MAKFHQPYVLCPLIGQRSLLGVVNDTESDCVIATLGKNMVIRYKLQNQKQINSWATRDKLTSPVIYDQVGAQYVGVFAQSQLRLWPESQEQLENVKKYKFQVPIHCVLEGIEETGPVVVYQNGVAMPLNAALETRKNTDFTALLKPGEVIQDCRLVVHEGIKQVAILAKTSKGQVWCCMVPVSEDWVSHRFELTCGDAPDTKLVGHAFMSDGQICRLFTLWSDGRLFVQPTVAGGSKEIIAVLTTVSTTNPVSMLPLSPSQLALYGADPSEEGAVLLVYNVRFGLVQCQQHLKLFSAPPSLWGCGQNLLLALGSSLLVVPYCLEAERLAAVLGSHRPVSCSSTPTDDVELIVELREASWGHTPASPITAPAPTPSSLIHRLQQLEAKGCPQAMMLEELLPELLEAEQVDAANWCLEHLSDVSERSLVDVLQFCLQRTKQNTEVDKLLSSALGTGFCEEAMLGEVRRLSLGQALELLHRLVKPLDGVEDAAMLRWITLLLDAHYQQYLLARDPQVLDILSQARDYIAAQLADVVDLKNLLPLIHAVRSGKPIRQNQQLCNLYNIEHINLC